jgi:hypothetical protein
MDNHCADYLIKRFGMELDDIDRQNLSMAQTVYIKGILSKLKLDVSLDFNQAGIEEWELKELYTKVLKQFDDAMESL